MYIHICIYTHVAYRRQCIPNIQNTFRNDASSARYTSIYTSIYIYVCVYVYIHICTYTYVYTHMNIHICIYTYTHVAYRQQCIPKIQNTFRNDASSATYAQYTSIYIYMCVYVYIHICTYTYVYTHMYIHICNVSRAMYAMHMAYIPRWRLRKIGVIEVSTCVFIYVCIHVCMCVCVFLYT